MGSQLGQRSHSELRAVMRFLILSHFAPLRLQLLSHSARDYFSTARYAFPSLSGSFPPPLAWEVSWDSVPISAILPAQLPHSRLSQHRDTHHSLSAASPSTGMGSQLGHFHCDRSLSAISSQLQHLPACPHDHRLSSSSEPQAGA